MSTAFPLNQRLRDLGWFRKPGAYFIVDGQYGSTGKGALAAFLAPIGLETINCVMTNAGPNSGHTGYMPAALGGEKIVTRQIPVGAVVLKKVAAEQGYFRDIPAYLSGGAVIDPDVLSAEVNEHKFSYRNLIVHPNAAVISPADKDSEANGGPSRIASTGKGVGAALASKIMREGNTVGQLFKMNHVHLPTAFMQMHDRGWVPASDVVLVEAAQGFSLGLQDAFYPHVTSRECTVQQVMADARMPLSMRRKVAMCIRTFPIRVGNTDRGTSGPCYPDQREISWASLGVEPELTTVTGRRRRVFTFSHSQFIDAIRVNEPDLLFVTFLDYLPPEARPNFLRKLVKLYEDELGRKPEAVLYSTGPRPEDIDQLGSL